MSTYNGWIPHYEPDAKIPAPCTANAEHDAAACEAEHQQGIEVHKHNIAAYSMQHHHGGSMAALDGHLDHLADAEYRYRLAVGWHKDEVIARLTNQIIANEEHQSCSGYVRRVVRKY